MRLKLLLLLQRMMMVTMSLLFLLLLMLLLFWLLLMLLLNLLQFKPRFTPRQLLPFHNLCHQRLRMLSSGSSLLQHVMLVLDSSIDQKLQRQETARHD
jgi:hypothetical protein